MRLISIVSLLTILSCDLFSPREAQPPDDTIEDCFKEPIISDYIIQNLECSLPKKRLSDYMSNLSIYYKYYLDKSIDNTVASEFSFSQEENVMTKVFELSDSLMMDFYDSTITFKDALIERVNWHYQGFLVVSDTTYNIAGSIALELVLQQQYWAISKWNDLHDATTDSTKAVTFGWIKDKFNTGELP